MAAVWIRAMNELRARWRAWLAIALMLGIAAGVVMAAAAGARRTDSAVPRFLNYAQAATAKRINAAKKRSFHTAYGTKGAPFLFVSSWYSFT